MTSRGGTKEEQQHATDTLKMLVKLGKIDQRALIEVEDARLIEIMGCTPEEFDRQDANRIEILKAVWAERAPETKQMRKGMR